MVQLKKIVEDVIADERGGKKNDDAIAYITSQSNNTRKIMYAYRWTVINRRLSG